MDESEREDDYKEAVALSARVRSAFSIRDEKTLFILSAHYAIDQEMQLAISRSVPRPQFVINLPFRHKLSLLRSLEKSDVFDPYYKATAILDDLRNIIAHAGQGEAGNRKIAEFCTSVSKAHRTSVPNSNFSSEFFRSIPNATATLAAWFHVLPDRVNPV